jgi:AcrR family transcriptional regulator
MTRLPIHHNTREAVLRAAIGCISNYGIEKTTVSAIAKKAKITRSLVSYYLPKKENLLLEVMRYISASIQTSVEEQVINTLDPFDQLIARIQTNLVYFLENPDHANCYNLFYYYAGVSPDFKEWNSTIAFRAREKIQKLVEKIKSKFHSNNLSNEETTLIIHDLLVRTIQRQQIELSALPKAIYLEKKMNFFKTWLPVIMGA